MNKILTSIVFIILLSTGKSYSQYADSTKYKFHMENAKISNQKGLKLLIIGGSCIAIGSSAIVLYENGAFNSNKRNGSAGDVMNLISVVSISILGIGGGTVVSLVSVPFFITAHSERKKAMRFQPIIKTINISGRLSNTVGIKISF